MSEVPEDLKCTLLPLQVISASVVKTNNTKNVVTFSLTEKRMTAPVTNHKALSLSDFLPGSLVSMSITKKLNKGVAVKFADVFDGTVDWCNLPATSKPDAIEDALNGLVGKKVNARILFCDLENKIVGFTLIKELVSWKGFEFSDDKMGAIYQAGVVARADAKSGITMLLPDSGVGFAHVSTVYDRNMYSF
jgi:ribosomal protein S1